MDSKRAGAQVTGFLNKALSVFIGFTAPQLGLGLTAAGVYIIYATLTGKL
jgi:hypothetical protein